MIAEDLPGDFNWFHEDPVGSDAKWRRHDTGGSRGNLVFGGAEVLAVLTEMAFFGGKGFGKMLFD